jgi:hypothetical protein
VVQMIRSMNEMGYPTPTLDVGCFMAGKLPYDQLVQSISNGLLSVAEEDVSAAAIAIEFWAVWAHSTHGERDMPPQRLMVLLTDHVQYRMKPGLVDVLVVCGRLVTAEWCQLEAANLEALECGLRLLLAETAILPASEGAYEVVNNADDDLACQLREKSALLAVRLSDRYRKEGKPLPGIVSSWLEQAAQDRLPEVRRALWKK